MSEEPRSIMLDHDLLPLRTARLVVRRLHPGDLASLLAYRNDPEIARFQGWTLPVDEEKLRATITESANAPIGGPDGVQLAVAHAESDVLIGDLYVGRWGSEQQLVIGYSFARQHHGRGYATEAVRGLLGLLFEQLGVHRVVATVDPRNLPSVALLERIGMRREGQMIQSYYDQAAGEWTDEYLYAILRDEWLQSSNGSRDAQL